MGNAKVRRLAITDSQPIPWSKVLHKLIFAELLETFSRGSGRFITVFTRARCWSLPTATKLVGQTGTILIGAKQVPDLNLNRTDD